jgi:hypothetical protein
MLVCLRHPGRVLQGDEVELDVEPDAFVAYARRDQTRTHLAELITQLNLYAFDHPAFDAIVSGLSRSPPPCVIRRSWRHRLSKNEPCRPNRGTGLAGSTKG